MKNSQCHDQVSVIQPPTTGPKVGAKEARPPTTDAAMTRCLPSKKTSAVVKTMGIIEPPKNPWSARKTIIDGMPRAEPQSKLLTVKPAAEAAKSHRVDI